MSNRLIWFRNDLRLHDNQTLSAAVQEADGAMACVYIYDGEPSSVGLYRQKHLAESLLALRSRLRECGAELFCLAGDPKELLPRLCAELKIENLYYARQTAFYERRDETELDQSLGAIGVRVHRFQTYTLVHDEDVDFDSYQPMGFTKRRSRIEKHWKIREPLPEPTHFPPALETNEPTWNFDEALLPVPDERGIYLRGGEKAALERVQDYFWEGDHLQTYRDTRNGLIVRNDSSKFSPYLALGCLSPRFVYQQVRRYERERVANGSTLWFLYELLWRDHFHYLAHARGAELFNKVSSVKTKGFLYWRDGRTGNAFVDAAMHELQLTGWMSNRMRQVAASFLVHNLGIDWRLGASWYETNLIDYDPCSNWGNWAYIAGTDYAGQAHVFDVEQQARMYDPQSVYAELWA